MSSSKLQSALRSDTIYGMRDGLRVGDNCPVCLKRIRKNDGFPAREKPSKAQR